MRPRPGTVLRPTARGVVVALVAAGAWVLADLTELAPARSLAAALVLALLLGAVCVLLSMIGLRAERRVFDEAVPVGSSARVRIDLARGAVVAVLPLGRGAVRLHLPAALGGWGDLPLDRSVPHVVSVRRRGVHVLGPFSLVVRDVFGFFHLRRTIHDAARTTGLPTVEELAAPAASAAGIALDHPGAAPSAPGVGEIGPIARPYAAGDDVRRVHWRASAHTGRLMTREDEPSPGQSAVIVIDTNRSPHPDPEIEDRLIGHAATVLESMGRNGWEVRVLDAGGDEITRAGRRRAIQGSSPLGQAADVLAGRAALLALAEVGFDDDPSASTVGHDHAAGHTALAIALGVDDGRPFDTLDLDRFAGPATHRTAIALGPSGEDSADRGADGHGPRASRHGAWTLVRGTTADSLSELLAATIEGDRP